MADGLELLVATGILAPSHLVRPEGHQTVGTGDQTGLLDPASTDPLVGRLLEVLPGSISGLAIGEGTADVLLGYLVARERQVPLASITNVDGMIQVRGRLAAAGEVWLLVTLLDEVATIGEFEAACRLSGAVPAGVVALVDRLPRPDPRVRSVVRWSDHLAPPESCPVCSEAR